MQVRCGRQAVVGPGQVLARGRPHHVGSDDDDELGFLLDEVAAAEQRAEHGHVLQPGKPSMFWRVIVRDQAGHRQRSARGQLTVDLACRFLSAGILMLESDDRAFAGQLADLGSRS